MQAASLREARVGQVSSPATDQPSIESEGVDFRVAGEDGEKGLTLTIAGFSDQSVRAVSLCARGARGGRCAEN